MNDKHLAYIRYGLGTMASAFDLWLIAITLIVATGHHVPWWAWVMLVVEFLVVGSNAIRYTKEKS